MKPARTLATLASLAAACACASPPASPPELMLVETAPVETVLDHADLPETHAVWREMIAGAADSIDLAFFYASNRPGSRLEPVVAAIEAAAGRGVRVRFLADAGFYDTYPETLDRLGARAGIEVRLYDLRTRTGGVLHAKYMLVDGDDAFFGSQNFDWRALEHIQELGVRCRVPELVEALGAVFDLDWRLAGDPSLPTPDAGWTVPSEPHSVTAHTGSGGSVDVVPMFSPETLVPDGAMWDLPNLVASIDGARSEVVVQLLSYSAFAPLEEALRSAAARGVHVKLLVADWSKREGTIDGLKTLQAVSNVSVRMMTIPAAESGFIPFARVIHAKYMVTDGTLAWVGTSNWSGSYFHASRNVGFQIAGEAIAERLGAFFDDNWTSPYAYDVDPDTEYTPPRVGE